MRAALPSLLTTALLAAACALPPAARAMDIPTYEKQRKEAATSPTHMRLRIYLLGIGEGLRLANVALRNRDESPLFCAPEQAAMTADTYKQAIDSSLGFARDTLLRRERSIESILLEALQDKYPCERRPAAAAPAAASAPASAPAGN
ncbi:MAG: hypothetical protein JNJ71_03880 [Rubrivivax sp.]|nr:hypothetical protein [Rubrivivax sp.]